MMPVSLPGPQLAATGVLLSSTPCSHPGHLGGRGSDYYSLFRNKARCNDQIGELPEYEVSGSLKFYKVRNRLENYLKELAKIFHSAEENEPPVVSYFLYTHYFLYTDYHSCVIPSLRLSC